MTRQNYENVREYRGEVNLPAHAAEASRQHETTFENRVEQHVSENRIIISALAIIRGLKSGTIGPYLHRDWRSLAQTYDPHARKVIRRN